MAAQVPCHEFCMNYDEIFDAVAVAKLTFPPPPFVTDSFPTPERGNDVRPSRRFYFCTGLSPI